MKPRPSVSASLAIAAVFCCSIGHARAEQEQEREPETATLPLWEIGVGAAHFNMPQYIGSDQRTKGSLPFPYFVFRGEKINISRDALSGRLFKSAQLVIDLSADFSLPVDSSENDAREGMPYIDLLVELGPAWRYIFVRNTEERRTLSIDLPLRGVLQSDLRYLSFEGWRVNPRLRYQEYFGTWKASAWLGVYFNDHRYNELFYSVAPEYATEDRPQYSAGSGFGGWAASVSMSYRRKAWWVGGYFRLFDIQNASFADSPLVIKQSNIAFGIAAAWIFKSSSTAVPRWQ